LLREDHPEHLLVVERKSPEEIFCWVHDARG
jgi:hypothetical protein